MKSTEVSVFRGTNTVVAMSNISLPREVLAVTTITSGGSWRNQAITLIENFRPAVYLSFAIQAVALVVKAAPHFGQRT
jgi:hypothetical protein